MIRIEYKDIPVGALEESNIEFNNKQYFVDENELKDEIIEAEKYGTLEQDFYLLDGTFKTFPDVPVNMEYMSEEMSNENGIFENPIVMTRTFENRYSATGMTIKFDTNTGDYCTELNISWYREGTLIKSREIYPIECECIIEETVEAFDKVIITFYKTSKPYRYLKVYYLIDGLTRIFNDDELMNVSVIEEISETGETLPINVLDFEIIAKKELLYLFQSKQPLKVFHNNNFIGTFFVDTAKQKSKKEFSINTINYIGIIDKEKTMGGIYKDILLNELLSEILENIPYELDEELNEITLSGYLPILSKREALQQIAFVTGTIIDTSRNDLIRIRKISNSISDNFDRDRVFRGIETEISAITTQVQITEHNYMEGADTTTIFEEILDKEIKIEFAEPLHSLEIIGGEIIKSHINYVVIKGEGTKVTLTGKNYIDRRKVIVVDNTLVTASTIQKIKKFESITLITNQNSIEVANRIAKLCFFNKRVKCKLIIDETKVGEVINIVTDYGIKKAIILELSLDINGKKKYANAKLLEVE